MRDRYPNPLDIIAISHVTHWSLADIQQMQLGELKFWIAQVSEFVNRQNQEIEQARRDAQREVARRKRR